MTLKPIGVLLLFYTAQALAGKEKYVYLQRYTVQGNHVPPTQYPKSIFLCLQENDDSVYPLFPIF